PTPTPTPTLTLTLALQQGSRRATLACKNKGSEEALEWALEHTDDKDFNDPMP
ncbi:unnamed protein product, partial [Discosporangium mesarthrocarpum]